MNDITTGVDAAWLKEHASMGIETIATEHLPLPYVSLTQTTSSKTFLADGRLAPAGMFYYAATKEAKSEFSCALLTVEHKALPNKYKEGEMVDTFVFIGATEGNWMPFLFACRGMSHGSAGKFIRDLKIRNEAPMFAYRITLKARLVETKNGPKYVVVFSESLRDNKEEILFLSDLTKKMSGRMVEGVEIGDEDPVDEKWKEEAVAATVKPDQEMNEDIKPEDVPF